MSNDKLEFILNKLCACPPDDVLDDVCEVLRQWEIRESKRIIKLEPPSRVVTPSHWKGKRSRYSKRPWIMFDVPNKNVRISASIIESIPGFDYGHKEKIYFEFEIDPSGGKNLLIAKISPEPTTVYGAVYVDHKSEKRSVVIRNLDFLKLCEDNGIGDCRIPVSYVDGRLVADLSMKQPRQSVRGRE